MVRIIRRNPTLFILTVLALAFLTVSYLLPIYVMFATSLKTPVEITQRTYLVLSGNLQWENYATALRLIAPALRNSSIISFTVTLLATFFGALGGYYLARVRAGWVRVLFILVGIALYLPYQVVLIPLVQLMALTRLALTHAGLILSYLVLNVPLASVLMGTFFLSVPRELEEAAEVDGANKLQIFFRVVTPISLPAYASVAIIIFTQVWNEFLLALTLSTPLTTTIQVKLAEVKGSFVALYNLQMAAALIAVLIPLTFFLLLGRYFIRGILAGALKG
ncbi:carbohydrate ABC transporter permease [uncultured Thermanaerothrix sp.]|uniref:carbohydrate ABC transporter permease n=1 Tax=uncultured Thermanaerothrix sp. TaxID=1195149 RepID=UPI00262E7788|nr:carbohydrate ABC transporter permease [uncultured Thermanaerothrix sp.]